MKFVLVITDVIEGQISTVLGLKDEGRSHIIENELDSFILSDRDKSTLSTYRQVTCMGNDEIEYVLQICRVITR